MTVELLIKLVKDAKTYAFLLISFITFNSGLLLSMPQSSAEAIDSLISASSNSNSPVQVAEALVKASGLSQNIGYNKGIVNSNIRLASKAINSDKDHLGTKLSIIDSLYISDISCFSDTALFRYHYLKGVYFGKAYDRVNQLNYFIKADSISQKMNSSKFTRMSYTSFASYYASLKNFDMAIKYHKLILDQSSAEQSTAESKIQAVALLNIGRIYQGLGQFDSTIYYIKKSISLSENKTPSISIVQNITLGQAYLMINELDSAEMYSNKANSFLTQNNSIVNSILNSQLKGEIRIKQSDLVSASTYIKHAYHLADSIDYYEKKIESNKSLIQIHLLESGYDGKALDHLLEDLDSVHLDDLKIQDKEMMAKYEAEKKELKIRQLSFENSRKRLVIGGVIMIGLLSSLLLFFRFNFKKKILKEKVDKEKLENEILNFELDKTIEKVKDHTHTINQLKTDLKENNSGVDMINEISTLLDQNYINDNHWLKITSYFDKLNDNFIQKAVKKHPNLTKNDIRLLVLIKSQYSNFTISEVKNISESSVKKSKQRLLAKLKISSFDKLEV